MKSKLALTALLASSIAAGPLAAPALADGAASTRNIILLGAGAAAAVGITNYNHKKRIKQQEQQSQARRQANYRQWFYNQHGYYPTNDQYRNWYYQRYGTWPS